MYYFLHVASKSHSQKNKNGLMSTPKPSLRVGSGWDYGGWGWSRGSKGTPAVAEALVRRIHTPNPHFPQKFPRFLNVRFGVQLDLFLK